MKNSLKSNKALKRIIREVAETAGYLWQRGWAERNAGNISVNINDILKYEIIEFSAYPYYKLPVAYPKLAGGCFFVTGAGKRMRDLATKPMQNALIIKLNEEADGYWILSQKAEGDTFMPTSELATHLGIHHMVAQRGTTEKVVMHTHTTELITLTHAGKFCNEAALNNLLWGMHPETTMFVPKGVGFVAYSLPGSAAIAAETIKALQGHDVAVWEKHGVFAIGDTASGTFDLIDILAKSAHIFVMCRSAGIITTGLTAAQLNDLKKLAASF